MDGMFVSIAIDPGSEERARELADLLGRYGFEKIQRGLWESTSIAQDLIGQLKRDMDRATDSYDRIRIYQYPMDGFFVISGMREKKWRRLVAKQPAAAATGQPPSTSAKIVLVGKLRPAAARPGTTKPSPGHTARPSSKAADKGRR
jgi:CRISPR-associated protein Cas2